jgi:nucleoside-diphosphate-sugar epimerase
VDAVVHAAAWVADHGPAAPAEAVNLTGTGHVLHTWPAARFVQVSSASVYHPARPQRTATEEEAPDPGSVRWPSPYCRTKALAERLVLAGCPGAVVLRPHAVYGPGDTMPLPRLTAAVRAGVLLLPGSGRQRHSLTRVEQLAHACLLACAPARPGHPPPSGIFNVTDAEPVVLAEALAESFRARGLRVRIVPVGYRPALAAAVLGTAMRTAVRTAVRTAGGRAGVPALTVYAAGHLALERTFDLSRARDRLGYSPPPTDLGDAARW